MITYHMAKLDANSHFENIRWHAIRARLWNRLVGRPDTLHPFSAVRPHLRGMNPIYRGVHEIPLAAIVGSVGRARDFDPHFRPLTDTTRQRWMKLHTIQQTTGFKPINVYKVGNLYFVEDGHHRVSVASADGLAIIEAHVYEYPIRANPSPEDSLTTIVDKLSHAQRTC